MTWCRTWQALPAVRHVGPHPGLPRAPPAAAVLDQRRRGEAPLLPFQQAEGPGLALGRVCRTQPRARGRSRIDPDQHRRAPLVDRLVRAEADGAPGRRLVVRGGPHPGGVRHAVPVAQRPRTGEHVAPPFPDAAVTCIEVAQEVSGADEVEQPKDGVGKW